MLRESDVNNKDGEINETLLSITLKVTPTERLVGAAFINMYERSFLITEFADNEHLSGLESLINQQNNSAVDSKFKVLVYLQNEMMRDKVMETLQLCEVDFCFSDDRKQFQCKEIETTLAPLLKESFDYNMEESTLELALSALNAGINNMHLTSFPDTAQKQFTLKKYTLGQYLRLDVAALKSLNVFP